MIRAVGAKADLTTPSLYSYARRLISGCTDAKCTVSSAARPNVSIQHWCISQDCVSDAFAGRKHFFYSLFMEFLGLMLFSLFGNSVTPEFAPAGNGAQEQMGNTDFTVQASSTRKVQVVSYHV